MIELATAILGLGAGVMIGEKYRAGWILRAASQVACAVILLEHGITALAGMSLIGALCSLVAYERWGKQ